MYYLIAYDIASAKRLRRILTLCKDHGRSVQKSLFECHLTHEQFQHLWQQLLTIVEKNNDHLLAYPICQSCLKNACQYPAFAIHPRAPSAYVF